MKEFNVVTEGNATGKYFYINLGADISQATGLKIDFTMPCGTPLIKEEPDVSLGTVDLLHPDTQEVIALANQYLVYQWVDGDIPLGSSGVAKAYPSMTINGVYRAADCSACFRILAKNACC